MAQRGVNKVILLGNLGKDPEVKYMPNGNAVANITLATSETWNDKSSGEKQEKTEWHRVVFFGKLAEIVVSVGLAQNLAAIRALSTEGIQRGHMNLHAQQVAIAAGAQNEQIQLLAQQLVAEKTVRIDRAKEILDWVPEIGLEEGLRKTIEDFESRMG